LTGTPPMLKVIPQNLVLSKYSSSEIVPIRERYRHQRE